MVLNKLNERVLPLDEGQAVSEFPSRHLSPALPLVKNEHSYTQAGNRNLEGAHDVVT